MCIWKMGNSTVLFFFFLVQYLLVGNLLYPVTKTSHLIVPSSYCIYTNITCDYTFVIFGGSLIFSHIWWYNFHIMQYQHYMWMYFCHIQWFLYFFSHLMVPFSHCVVPTHVCCTFVTFNDSLIFSHILWFHCYIRQY